MLKAFSIFNAFGFILSALSSNRPLISTISIVQRSLIACVSAFYLWHKYWITLRINLIT